MKLYLFALYVLTCMSTNVASAAGTSPGVTALAPDVPAGAYRLDLSHASLLFRVDHLGFSRHTARFKGFDAQLRGEEWLSADEHPRMTFVSQRVVLNGSNTATIDGELTMRGVTRPVTLEATFNGGYAGHPMDPQARIGFSAHGVLQRSEFGMTYGIPEPGSKMGVSDEVEIIIEAEFSGPAWQEKP